MTAQRGVALVLAMVISLLAGVLMASATREAVAQAAASGSVLATAQAFEAAEATLLEGLAHLQVSPPGPCQPCTPPHAPHDLLPGVPGWQWGEQGAYLLQRLGTTIYAAGWPPDVPATLYRITAVSSEPQARQVLEAVYAMAEADAHPVQRVMWRQRLPEP